MLEHDAAPAEVCPLSQFDGEIKAAVVVQTGLTVAEIVAERAEDTVGDQLCTGKELEVAIAAQIEISNPALQVQRLAGAVYAAIIPRCTKWFDRPAATPRRSRG